MGTIVYRICHFCHKGYNPSLGERCECGPRNVRNAQVGENEATAVAIHPVTGEPVFCFNEDPTAPMPEVYAKEGFEKVQFHHYRDLDKWCKENGFVNDGIEGYHKDDGYFEEDYSKRQKVEKERVERYLEEREKARKAMR